MKQSKKQAKVSRRNFLKGVGVAAGATVTAAGCTTRQVAFTAPTPEPATLPVPLQYPQAPYTPLTPPPAGVLQVLTPHEAQTVEALTARILPGTPDDPGAREAGVVFYIDNMLAFNEGFNEATYRQPPYAQVYVGDQPPAQPGAIVPSSSSPHNEPTPAPNATAAPTGTSSATATPAPTAPPTPTLTPPPADPSAVTSTAPITGTAILTDTMVTAPATELPATYQLIWVPASEIARYGYQSILSPREVYRIGIAAVDRYTNSQFGKNFMDLREEQQDQVIGAMANGQLDGAPFDPNVSATSFFHNLRRHTAEGMFSDPVYGGNRNLVGWQLVGYPGAQRAYQPYEFQQEGTNRQPQSILQMHAFNPGQPANDEVILPVSGSADENNAHH